MLTATAWGLPGAVRLTVAALPIVLIPIASDG
jgi:hypothetical protein